MMEKLQTPALSTAEIVADTLIAEMLTGSRILIIKCIDALRTLGPAAITRLQIAADDETVTLSARSTLRIVSGFIQENGFWECSDTVVVTALAHAWRLNRKPLHSRAKQTIELLCGPDYVDKLIRVAMDNIGTPNFCVRLLQAVEECGQQPTAATWMALHCKLSFTDNAHILDEAARLIDALTYEGAPLAEGVTPEFFEEFHYSLMRTPASAPTWDAEL